jgi:hypothetical protein
MEAGMSDYEVTDEFRADTLEKASWAMRKYRRLAQKKAQYESLAAAERVRIDSWLERMIASVESQMEFFGAHLEAYAMSQRAQGNKSVELPDGTIKTRATGATFDVDKTVFLEWAQEQKRDDLMRVSFAPDMTAIKTAVLVDEGIVVDPASGEVVPGLSPVPEKVTVSIAPDLDAIDLEGIEGIEDE